DERSPRGGRMCPTPVAAKADSLGLPVLKPVSLKDDSLVETLSGYAADLIVVVAFKILREKLYTLPRLGSINIHASLLPRYRGAAPINWALINGETETGLTSFFLRKKVDTGDIIMQESVSINDDDTYDTLAARLSELAGPFLLRTLDMIERGQASPVAQDDELATPAPKISPFDALIDFGFPAERVRNFVRGLSSQPGAYTHFRGRRVKVLSCHVYQDDSSREKAALPPGSVVSDPKRLIVQCANSAVEIDKVLPEGKKLMDGTSFLNGFKPQPGERFGIRSKGNEQKQ
ncbi:MAG: methionyl-tRNA formyltransferase, partial [Candidatus Zixiibacteriota bacterium]